MAEAIDVGMLPPEPIQIKKEMDYQLKAAGFWTRFWAYLIDLIVVFSINAITVKPLFFFTGWENIEIFYIPLYGSMTSLLFYAYFVVMTKIWGQTVGKMVLGIRVVSEDGKPLSWATVFFREWIGRFISVTIDILYILVAFTPNHKAIHDYIADTKVIHERTFEAKAKILETEVQPKQKIVDLDENNREDTITNDRES
ncbi:RDD family protein [Rummeliibacillus sp. SL167]|uniref:RDD family protein n=1 Tax=Rummeliibacillus sp. SL167 TaxID=2579792 RepID=UPI002105E813|nr:RDD family protein [Rummeliibacillus sp. SL167]